MNKERELLRRALEILEWADEFSGNESLENDIRAYLAAEPEAEPVGYVYTDFESGIKQGAIDDHSIENGTPLYTTPEPSRKPMTEEEIWSAYRTSEDRETFFDGVRFAEKHHRIGGDDE